MKAEKKRRLYEQLAILVELLIAARSELLQNPNTEISLALKDGV